MSLREITREIVSGVVFSLDGKYYLGKRISGKEEFIPNAGIYPEEVLTSVRV